MHSTIKGLAAIIALGAAVVAAADAQASVIDLRDLASNIEQQAFGQPNTVFYAQSVIADGTFINEARVRVTTLSGGGPILFNFMITGDRVDAGGGLGFAPDLLDIRFNSGMLAEPVGGGETEFVISPNIVVAPGERMFLVFDAFSYPASGVGSMEATELNAVDHYLLGEFVFFNQSGQSTFEQINGLTWVHRGPDGQDLAILVSFTDGQAAPAPTPLALILLGLAGIAYLQVRGKAA